MDMGKEDALFQIIGRLYTDLFGAQKLLPQLQQTIEGRERSNREQETRIKELEHQVLVATTQYETMQKKCAGLEELLKDKENGSSRETT